MSDRPEKGKSLIEFPDEYVCIDVETTGLNFHCNEIIEVSALLVEHGAIIDHISSLVRPKETCACLTPEFYASLGYEGFVEFCKTHLVPPDITELTGITNEMVLAAPYAEDVMPPLQTFIGDRILVGHNVNFDINFIYDTFEQCGMTLKNDFVDTMRIARKLFPDLEHHRLSDIVSHLNISQDTAHRAEADAVATYQCFEKMRRIVSEGQTIPVFQSNFKKSGYKKYKSSLSAISATVDAEEIDETNPVYGKSIVFTGALSSMGRKEALQIVANLGGSPANGITKKTNFLVVGNEEFASSVKDGKTAKMKKAEEYRRQGLDIMTLSEDTFFQMIEPYIGE